MINSLSDSVCLLVLTLVACGPRDSTLLEKDTKNSRSAAVRGDTAAPDDSVLATIAGNRIQFEETALTQVRHALGGGTIYERGQEGEHTYNLCYEVRGDAGTIRVIIGSHSEMGGPDHTVGFVGLQDRSLPAPRGAPCYPARGPVELRLNGHQVVLGLSAAELRERFGASARELGDTLRFDWSTRGRSHTSSPTTIVDTVTFDVSTTLEALMRAGRAVSITLYRVTTT
jgi:hypothetical protein